MSDAIVITHSDIASWLRCRRQFALGYVDDFHLPERPTGALATGSRVHQAIDHYITTGDDPVAEHQRLAEAAEKELLAADSPPWVLSDLYEDIIVGRNCVVAYMEWVDSEGPYAGYEIKSEVKLRAPILGGRVELMGKADILLTRESDGWLFVDDLKTASAHTRTSLPVQLERSYQHNVYLALNQLINPAAVVGGAWYTVLYKAKNPARVTHPMVERFAVPARHSQAPIKMKQIERICSDILRFMDELATDGISVAYPTPGDSCRWCDFKHPCMLLDETPVSARAMLDDQYERGTRHGRYSR